MVLKDANSRGLTETNNCYYHVAYRPRTLSKTEEPTEETAQWERSNSRLFLIFAGALFCPEVFGGASHEERFQISERSRNV